MVLVTMQRVERLWRKLTATGRVVDATNVYTILLKTATTEMVSDREAALIDELEMDTPWKNSYSIRSNKRQLAAV